MKSLTYTIDMIQACIFAVLAGACIYGVAVKGAWWHIETAVICTAVALALRKDARKEAGK